MRTVSRHTRVHPPRPRRRRRFSRRRLFRLARTFAVLAALLVATGLLLRGHLADAPRAPAASRGATAEPRGPERLLPDPDGDGVKIGTFLGGEQRRVYGLGPVPTRLRVLWKARIGRGWTSRKSDGKQVLWAGTGWTGQPTLVREGGRDWLLVGGFDHGLRRIDAETGKVAWRYEFDDVIKGTNTVVEVERDGQRRTIVICGSRRGAALGAGDPRVAPLRAIDFATGRELWRQPVPRTDNYSRDVDASPLLAEGVLYAPVEPGIVFALDPLETQAWGRFRRPVEVGRSRRLYTAEDVRAHPDVGGANLAIEGSPTLLGDVLYVAAGSGHVWGLRLPELQPVWDFRTGSDIDSTPVATRNGRLLVGIERQYVEGSGGVMMLDPAKPPADAVDWFFPTPDRGIGEWEGGVVGSVAVNDEYDERGRQAPLAAFNGVDGGFYIVSQDQMAEGRVRGPNGERGLKTPKLVFSDAIGGSISTPAFVGDCVVTAGYDRKVHVYRLSYGAAGKGRGVDLRCRDGRVRRVSVREVGTFETGGSVESTPLVWRGRIYIGSRDGWFYCLGDE